MIEVLQNPKTDRYLELKKNILCNNFPWYWRPKSTVANLEVEGHRNIPHYSHTLLERPDVRKFSETTSVYLEPYIKVAEEILEYNGIRSNYFFLRACINCVHPTSGIPYCIPHVDHHFPHKNLIMYITNSGGNTYVEGEQYFKKYEEYVPEEDDVVLFSGKHYMQAPKEERRIVILSTLFES
tara:strand:- start:303 stop:848 length:546 start_codon:yes stop_codon:yes gene_type:complete